MGYLGPVTVDGGRLQVPPPSTSTSSRVPHVTQPTLATPEFPCVLGSELLTSLPDGLVGDEDAALREEFFDIAEAQAESVV